MLQAMRFIIIAVSVLASGCTGRTPAEAQTFGAVTGVFTRFRPADTLCQLLTLRGTALGITFVEPGSPDDALTLSFSPLSRADRRFIVEAPLRYGAGETTQTVADLERGHRLLDPSGQHLDAGLVTGLVFPLFIHQLRVTPGRLCNATALGEPLTGDCLDVPESTMRDARFWCSVSVLAPPELSE